MSGGRATHGDKGVGEVVGEVVPGTSRDVNGIPGWVTGREGGRIFQGGY